MKRRILFTSVIIAASLTLTACASVPDLNPQQSEMITEYAAALMLKYDAQNHSRLVDTGEFKNSYLTAKRIYDEGKAQYYAAIEKEEQLRRNEALEQENGNAGYSQQTGRHSAESNDGTGGATVVNNESIDSFLNLKDFGITYAGFDTCKLYPEEPSEFYVACDASKGHDLLIVYFNVVNRTNNPSKLNILELSPVFKLSVNGGSYMSAFKTFLEDDLSEYVGNFTSGESKRLVLIAEVDEGTTVSSMNLRVSYAGDSITKPLK